jgi:hypothetical protein
MQRRFSGRALAGLELGVWNFGGIAAAATGLSLTSATTAATINRARAGEGGCRKVVTAAPTGLVVSSL